MLVNLDPMAPADVWNAAARKCWTRELEDLKTYGVRMREDVTRDQFTRSHLRLAACGWLGAFGLRPSSKKERR